MSQLTMISPYLFVGLCRGEKGISKSNLDNMPADIVDHVLHERLNKIPRHEVIEICIDEACKFYSVTRDDLFDKNRNSNLVETRYAVMYVITKYFGVKKLHISRYLKLDNSTCHHGINKVQERLEDDPEFENEIKTLANNVRMRERRLFDNH